MHRLFVAIRPSQPMRAALSAMMGGIAGARWQDDAQLHLTLRFIGEVDRHLAEDIAAGLAAIRHPSFMLALDRAGQFERKGRVESVWIGVTPPEPVHTLHNKIDRLLVGLGLAPDPRSYLPHITIARLGRMAGDVGGFFEAVVVPHLSAEIDEFCLYESRLGGDGPVYTIIARYPLG